MSTRRAKSNNPLISEVNAAPLIIWIIDNDIVSLFALRYRIEQSDSSATVLDFDTTEHALQAYIDRLKSIEELPNIIFLDLMMPGMSGWQFLESLSQVFICEKTPDIYVLSAFSNTDDKKQAEANAAVIGHFDKPLSKMDMDRTLSIADLDIDDH